MGNIYTNLAVPAGAGAGAGAAVGAMGSEKTITVQGAFGGVIHIEVSLDGATWAQVHTFYSPGKKVLNFPALQIRVNRAGTVTGTPNVDVAANDNGAQFATLVAPAVDGTGASVDVSALGEFNAVTVLGTFSGVVTIEISEDNTDWAQCMSFLGGSGGGIQTKRFTAQFMRVRRSGVTTAGTPTVIVGAANDATSAFSAGAQFNYFGDGSDGDVTLGAPLTLTRDMYYNTLDTATFIVDTAGFRIFVRDTLTMGAGSIIRNNGANASGATAGAAGAAGALGGGAAGGDGGANGVGTDGGDVTAAAQAANRTAGAGGTGEAVLGGAAGVATALTALQSKPNQLPEAVELYTMSVAGGATAMTAGAGGGGGGGDATPGTGGGGGGGGGLVMIAAHTIIMDATAEIQALGGDGANGVAANGGGGGGGTGGAISLVYHTATLGVLDVSGGAGSLGAGTGSSGGAGAAGTTWQYDVSV